MAFEHLHHVLQDGDAGVLKSAVIERDEHMDWSGAMLRTAGILRTEAIL